MQKLLFVAPHLSTGGQPQYLLKKIEALKNDFVVYVIEYTQISDQFVVQRNKIIKLIGKNFYSLKKDKTKFIEIVKNINPDIIHLEEHPECFYYEHDDRSFGWLYRKDRQYKLLETCHNSTFNINHKKHYPDKFIFVSQGQADRYKEIRIPYEVIEYPMDLQSRTLTREQACKQLGLDPKNKQVLTVGLFTSGKNQGCAFDIANQMSNHKIQFNFVGNQAGNFKEYWQPLMDNKPDNCKVWGERSDVDVFYQACDLLVFPSILETNPLVVREALSWDMPVLMYNLPIYSNAYSNIKNVYFLKRTLGEEIEQVKDILTLK